MTSGRQGGELVAEMPGPAEGRSRTVIALGGNAIQKASQVGTIEEQFENSLEACRIIVRHLVETDHRVILTHGNGPQVGKILRRVELARKELYPLPLDICVADSQGGMGYMLQQVLQQALAERGIDRVPVTVLTRTVVDPEDPAFENPTKPIGAFLDEKTAKEHAAQEGWIVREDAGRGWRRVVPSPRPREILEAPVIKRLFDAGEIVVAAGGGGIPVMRRDGYYVGVEAVIDKDLASALLANAIEADLFLILTGVERVALRFGKPDEKQLDALTVNEAKRYLAEGHFPPGSMGPKIEAAIEYLERGGKEALITSMEALAEALRGETGTRILPG